MQNHPIRGLHHVTALAGSAQGNLDFYAGVLGLRLVKKTVNFDAPDVYHLYYGDETGSAGSIMTFFPFGTQVRRGRRGVGQSAVTSFSVPSASLEYWLHRLRQFQVPVQAPRQRMDELILYFEDPDGLSLELVANDLDTRLGYANGFIPAEHAIRGFWGVELWETGYERTEAILAGRLDYAFVAESGSRRRYAPQGSASPGEFVDLDYSLNRDFGRGGAGTVHHIAFDTPSDEAQLLVREKVLAAGLQVTPVLDRQYFHSIYFREPGGVLFEVATTPPGFAFDEPVAMLGSALKLPPWEEAHRAQIEAQLPPIHFNPEAYESPA